LDPSISLAWVQDTLALAGDHEDEILRARNRTIQAKPDDVKAFFRAQLKKRVSSEPAARRPAPSLRSASDDDPYG
jgi:hypothetical protein